MITNKDALHIIAKTSVDPKKIAAAQKKVKNAKNLKANKEDK